jgi:hypothetical protein
MKLYYVDVIYGPNITLIAGPFRSEAIARKYEKAAAEIALAKGIMSPWGEFGVSSVSGGFNEAGPLNDELDIEAGDLINSL